MKKIICLLIFIVPAIGMSQDETRTEGQLQLKNSFVESEASAAAFDLSELPLSEEHLKGTTGDNEISDEEAIFLAFQDTSSRSTSLCQDALTVATVNLSMGLCKIKGEQDFKRKRTLGIKLKASFGGRGNQ